MKLTRHTRQVDKNNKDDLDEMFKGAESEKFEIGFSNISFEVWLLAHFEKIAEKFENKVINRSTKKQPRSAVFYSLFSTINQFRQKRECRKKHSLFVNEL